MLLQTDRQEKTTRLVNTGMVSDPYQFQTGGFFYHTTSYACRTGKDLPTSLPASHAYHAAYHLPARQSETGFCTYLLQAW